MAETIKGINVVIGSDTTGLSKALSDVNKNARDIQSELKQVEKLLKLDPTNTELLAQKQKLLADAVANTREKLDRLKAAQEQVNEQFAKGEISESQYRAFQRELIKTEQELKNLEKQLADVTSVTKKWEEQLKKASDGLKSTGAKITDIGKGLSAKVTAPIVAAGGAILALGMKAGQAADDINTLAKQTGLTTEQIQKFQYASDRIDVSLEVLTGSMAKLTRNMESARRGSKTQAEAFAALGVQITNNEGKLRNNQEVFNEIIDVLAKMENETQRDAYAMQIFGRSAQELNPLILGGADALKQLGEEAEAAGLILSQDALDAANEFNDEIDKLKAMMSATAIAIGAELAPIMREQFVPIMENTVIPALKSMSEKIANLVRWFADLNPGMQNTILFVVGLVAAIGPLLVVIGAMASGLGSVVGVISKTILFVPKLMAAFTMLTGPIGIVVAAIATLIAIGIALYKNWDEIKAKLAQIWDSIKETASKVWNAIKDFFKKWGDEILLIAAGPAGWAVLLARTLAQNWDSIKQVALNVWTSIKTGIANIWSSITSATSGAISDLYNTVKSKLESLWSYIKSIPSQALQWGKNIIQGLINGIKSLHIPMPHFNFSIDWKSIAGVKFPVPNVDVNWYAQGGIFTRPSIIGVGEAGPEAVIPLDRAGAIGGVTVNMYGPVNVRDDQDIHRIARELFTLQQRAARAKGLA